MIKKLLAFVIVLSLIGINIVTSTENLEEDISARPPFESVDSIKESSSCGHTVYFGGSNDPWECFIFEGTLNNTNNATCICNGSPGSNFVAGSTCINDEKIMVCEYSNGALYEIDPETCSITSIGGGGTGLNGLAYNPTNKILYGCSSNDLYKIDPETGFQKYIGPFNTGTAMIAIACDQNGSLFGWDVKFTGESYLFKIDTETGEATTVGSLGMTLLYAQDGDICKVDDIFYLAAYVYSPYYGSYLFTCDKETGECTLIDKLENVEQPSIFVIPWNFRPKTPCDPIPENGATNVDVDANLSWFCSDPDGDDITYNVYFGNKSPPPIVASGITETHYDPGIMNFETTYYWKIVTCDNHGASREGPVWNFTTFIPPIPEVVFVNPKEGYFHFSGVPLFQTILNFFADTATLGGFRIIPIQVNGTNGGPDDDPLMVKLFINNRCKGLGTWNPKTGYYEWKWTGWALGTYTIKVIAENEYGKISDWVSLDVWNFCFIP